MDPIHFEGRESVGRKRAESEVTWSWSRGQSRRETADRSAPEPSPAPLISRDPLPAVCCSPHPPAQRLAPELAPEMVLDEGGEAWFLRTVAWALSSRCHPWAPHLCPQPRYQHRHGWQMLGGAHRPRAWWGFPPCRWLPGVQLEGRKWEEWQPLTTWPEGLTAHVHPGVRPAPGLSSLSGGFHGPRSTWAVGSTGRTRGAHRAGLQRLEKSRMAPKCPSDRPEVVTAPRGWNASAFLDVPGECFP